MKLQTTLNQLAWAASFAQGPAQTVTVSRDFMLALLEDATEAHLLKMDPNGCLQLPQSMAKLDRLDEALEAALQGCSTDRRALGCEDCTRAFANAVAEILRPGCVFDRESSPRVSFDKMMPTWGTMMATLLHGEGRP